MRRRVKDFVSLFSCSPNMNCRNMGNYKILISNMLIWAVMHHLKKVWLHSHSVFVVWVCVVLVDVCAISRLSLSCCTSICGLLWALPTHNTSCHMQSHVYSRGVSCPASYSCVPHLTTAAQNWYGYASIVMCVCLSIKLAVGQRHCIIILMEQKVMGNVGEAVQPLELV